MTINLIYVFFAFGIFVSIIGWIGFGLVKIAALRVFLRSACVSIFATPSIIIGHGFAPAPALMVMTFKDHFFLGLIPILIVWFISFLIVMLIPKARAAKTKWPINLISALTKPAYIRLPLYGLVLSLIYMGSSKLISDHWYFGYILLFGGVIIGYFLCFYSSQCDHQNRFVLPLLFTAPVGIAGIFPFAVLWYVAGFTGVLTAEGKRKKALWVGAATSGILLIVAIMRLFLAIKYKDVSHVTIQGGVALASFTAGFFLCLSILFSLLAWTSKN